MASGRSHPFIGLDEALVHNGILQTTIRFRVPETKKRLSPFSLIPRYLFRVFDLLNRVYGYPHEYIIEALAPTAEMDFDYLPEEKQRIYRQIQAAHSWLA